MAKPLSLRLMNDSKSTGEGRWDWSVWVEGADHQLDRIKYVRYVLHHTFIEPIRIVRDRASKFQLRSSGWGEFSIVAQLSLLDGTSEELERWLRLDGGD